MRKFRAAVAEPAYFPLFLWVAEETYVLKVDVEAHQPGTDTVVPETSEDAPENLVIGVGGALSRVVLKPLVPQGIAVGSMHLVVTPAGAVQLLKGDKATPLTVFFVDLARPEGDLAGVVNNPDGVALYVRGQAQEQDVKIRYSFRNGQGQEIAGDEVHLSVAGHADQNDTVFEKGSLYAKPDSQGNLYILWDEIESWSWKDASKVLAVFRKDQWIDKAKFFSTATQAGHYTVLLERSPGVFKYANLYVVMISIVAMEDHENDRTLLATVGPESAADLVIAWEEDRSFPDDERVDLLQESTSQLGSGEKQSTCAILPKGSLVSDEGATIRVRLSDSCKKSKRVIFECSCQAGSCDADVIYLSSISLRLSLGKAENGLPAGDLYLREKSMSPDLAKPKGLRVSSLSDEVEEIYSAGRVIRQVKSSERFMNILPDGAYAYTIDIYDIGESDPFQEKENGRYLIPSGVAPTVTWRMENPDGPDSYHRLKVKEIKDMAITKSFLYVWNENEKTWDLRKGLSVDVSPLEIRTKKETAIAGGRIVVETVSKPGTGLGSGQASKVATTYRDFPWGEEIVQIVAGDTALDQDPPQATTIEFGETPGSNGYGLVKSRINPDGSWVRYEYDGRQRVTKEVHSWLNAGVGAAENDVRVVLNSYGPEGSLQDDEDSNDPADDLRPRRVIEKVQGIVVAKTYYAYKTDSNGARTVVSERCLHETAQYGDPTNERTKRQYFKEATGRAYSKQLKEVWYPDGRLDSYKYETGIYYGNANPALAGFAPPPAVGKAVRTTIQHGKALDPKWVPFKSTWDTSVRDRLGRLVLQETYVYNGAESLASFPRVKWTVMTYDAQGHPRKTFNSNNTWSETVWDCCTASSETDARGITRTNVSRDVLKRVLTESVPGPNGGSIITTYVLDALGRRVSQTVTGDTPSPALVTTTTYDQAGRVKSTTDAANLTTLYGYPASATTVAKPGASPGGATEITARYLDGRTKSVTGTAVIPTFYEYGVNPDGTQWTIVRTGREDSPMWEKTTTDLLGRTVRIEKPGFDANAQPIVEATASFYNAKGQLEKTSTTGVADTLREYDVLGNQTRSGLDKNANGQLDLASTDRIEETEASYAYEEDSWWQQTKRSVYATENSAAPRTLQTQKVRLTWPLTGTWPPTGTVEETKTVDENDNESVLRVTLNRAAATETRAVTYPDSTLPEVQVTQRGYVMSAASKTGVSTSYGYDDLGRRTTVTQSGPAGGTVVTHYNSLSQVESVDAPAHGTTTYGYDPVTGRKISETDELGHVTRYHYNARGQVDQTWGDAAYPVRFVYDDDYGRRTWMYTYRTEANWISATWPEDAGSGDGTNWQYDERTGVLLAKVDSHTKPVAYTYRTGGKLRTRTWARNDGGSIVTAYDYDPATGELTSVDYSDGTPDVGYTYDRLGRQHTVTDAAGTRTFSYPTPALQQGTESIVGLYTKTITRTYDDAGVVKGRPSGLSLGADYTVTWGHDNDPTGRLSDVAWSAAGTTGSVSYSYWPASDLLHTMSSTTGLQTTYAAYHAGGARQRVQNVFGATTVSDYQYGYDDPLGRRTSVSNTGSAFAQAAFNKYGYDGRSQLTDSDRYLGTSLSDLSQSVAAQERSYSYDPIGNRKTALQRENLTYAPNGLNQYDGVTPDAGAASSFSYDDDGNLTTATTGASSTTYVWDAENRLISVEPASPGEGSQKLAYVYDYQGRRVQKSVFAWTSAAWEGVPAATKRYLYDGWNLIEELDGSGQPTKAYVWGLDLSGTFQGAGGIGGAIAMIEGGDVYHYLYDGNGNVGQLVNAADGTVSATYEYDPYGNSVSLSGALAAENKLRFSTKYQEDETGLLYYGYRYYSPELGRWLSRDPLGERGGRNLYAFVSNRPTNAYDRLGLDENEFTYGEIRSWAITSMSDFSAPAGLGNAKMSIGSACSRGNSCASDDGTNATAPGDQAAWRNIVAATGFDGSGGGNFMCVGGQGCWFVHACYSCCRGRRVIQERAIPLPASGTVTVDGKGTLYFYNDSLMGWCSRESYIHGCTQ